MPFSDFTGVASFVSAPRDAEVCVGVIVHKASAAAVTDLAVTTLAAILADTAHGFDKLKHQTEEGLGVKLTSALSL